MVFFQQVWFGLVHILGFWPLKMPKSWIIPLVQWYWQMWTLLCLHSLQLHYVPIVTHTHQPRVNISQRLLQNTELSWEEINNFTRKTISICAKRYSLNPPWVSLNITSIHPVGSKHQTQRTPGDQQKYPVYYVWCSIPSLAHKRWKKARKWWC